MENEVNENGVMEKYIERWNKRWRETGLPVDCVRYWKKEHRRQNYIK